MVVTFSLDQEGVQFRIKITDCETAADFDVASVDSQKMIFYKPDGTVLEKTATLVDESGTFYVQYTNSASDSILDLTGEWENQAQITLTSGDVGGTSEKQVFWVVA